MIENGFVKLPRSIAKRSWFNKQNTLKLYVVLLLNAAFKDIEREGLTIRAGQFVTTRERLAEMCQLTVQQTRTALSHLVSTKDITVETTSNFTIITLNSDFDEQNANRPVNHPVNQQDNQQINHRSISSKIEVKKEESTKEEKEEAANAASSSPASFSEDFLKQRLVKEYGSELVELYENKFKAWASAKNAANVPMYPTIAKWLAQDKAAKTPPDKSPKTSPKTPPRESYPKALSNAEPKSPAQVSDNQHIDTAKLRAAVMAQYRKP